MDNIKVGTLVLYGKSIGVVVDIFNGFSYQVIWPNGFREWLGSTRVELMLKNLKKEMKRR